MHLSIEKLCEQIGKSNEEFSRIEQRSMLVYGGLTLMFAIQMFQILMMGQDRKIEMIQKQSNDIKAMMMKKTKDQKNEIKRKRKNKEKRMK